MAPIIVSDGGINPSYVGEIITGSEQRFKGYVKDLGQKGLYNEVAAYGLAKFMDLPVPTAYLVCCPTGLMTIRNAPVMIDQDGRAIGHLLFGMVDGGIPLAKKFPLPSFSGFPSEVAATLFAEAAEERSAFLRSWNRVEDAIAFDEWVANGDRHAGNLLWNEQQGDIWLIDHDCAFTGPLWSDASLSPEFRGINHLWESRYPGSPQKGEHIRLQVAVDDLVCRAVAAPLDEFVRAANRSCNSVIAEMEEAALYSFLNLRVPMVGRLLADRAGAVS